MPSACTALYSEAFLVRSVKLTSPSKENRVGARHSRRQSSVVAMAKAPSVVVVGGGIGGLASALALRKIAGIQDIIVLERGSTGSSEGGTGLMLWPNGLKALGHIDPALMQAAKDSGVVIRNKVYQRSSDITLIPCDEAQKFGEPMMCAYWKSLHQLLSEAVAEEAITVEVDKRCTGVQLDDAENQPGVTVVSSNGNVTTVHADMIVGADGIGSQVRKTLFGEQRPDYAGRVLWRAVIRDYFPPLIAAPQTSLVQDVYMCTMTNPTQMVTYAPVGSGNLYWACSSTAEEEDGAPPSWVRQDIEGDPELVKAKLLDMYGEFQDLCGMIEATPADRILMRPVMYRKRPLELWSKGRVVLLGDAAHAMLPSRGQGACCAFEDAVQLAYSLRDATHEGHHKDVRDVCLSAIAEYQGVRSQRVDRIQAESNTQTPQGFRKKTAEELIKDNEEMMAWTFMFEPVQRQQVVTK